MFRFENTPPHALEHEHTSCSLCLTVVHCLGCSATQCALFGNTKTNLVFLAPSMIRVSTVLQLWNVGFSKYQ